MMPPSAAWRLTRVLAGMDINGELDAMAEPWKGMASHLAELPPPYREAAFQAMLAARSDRDELVIDLANQRPDQPPPEDDEDAIEEWKPIRLGTLPPVDAFPVDVLPTAVGNLVIQGADSIGCPHDFLGVPVLAIAGGAVGRSVSLMLKNGYFASTIIFGACIGPPSDGKTPALKAVAAAIRKIDDALAAEHAQAIQRWNDTCDQAGPDKKKTKPPPPPRPRRIDVDDITMEALPLILADNPRGLIMIRDELTALILGMDQFKGGKGNDRSNAIKLWSGESIKKDRVNHENNIPVRSPHPSLTIVGGLPPDMLGELLDPKGRSDGFIDRFLLDYPDPLPVACWSDKGIPEAITDEWCAIVARLWYRTLNVKEGRLVPHVASFTPAGKARWEALYNAHKDEMNADDFPPALRGPWGKFREYAGRLTLILALLHHAADPTADPQIVPKVGPRDVENAWKLISYFKSHARRVRVAISCGRGIGGGYVVKAIVEWIRSGSRQSFSERDIKQARRWIGLSELADALSFLVHVNAIRAHAVSPIKPKGGHPPAQSYDVNPAIFS